VLGCVIGVIALVAIAVGVTLAVVSASDDSDQSSATEVTLPTVGNPDAPAICDKLARAKSLVELRAAVPDLLDVKTKERADAIALAALQTLRNARSSATEQLAEPLDRATSALDALEQNPAEPGALAGFGSAFSVLGDDVQTTCRFQLG